MSSINRVILVGRLSKDADLKKTQSGMEVAGFTIAVDRYVKDKEPQTDFINCVAWNKTAENVGKYTAKGSLVAVEGRIQVRKYQNKQRENRYATEVVCDNVQFLSRKESTQEVVENDFKEEMQDTDSLPF